MAVAGAIPALFALKACVLVLDYDDYGNTGPGSGGAGGASEQCEPGTTRECNVTDAGAAGAGVCTAGTQACNADGNGYGECVLQAAPMPERAANDVDEDCDGDICVPPDWGLRSNETGDEDLSALALQGEEYALVTGSFKNSLTIDGVSVTQLTPASNETDWWAAKIDLNRTVVWVKNGLEANVWQESRAVTVDPSGAILVAGSRRPSGGGIEDGFVVELNRDTGVPGIPVVFSSTGGTRANAVFFNDAGGFIVSGTYAGIPSLPISNPPDPAVGGKNIVVASRNAANWAWAQAFPGGGEDDVLGMAAASDSAVIITGKYQDDLPLPNSLTLPLAGTKSDILVMKLDPNDGHPLWADGFVDGSDTGEAAGLAAAVDGNNNVLVTGAMYGTTDFGGDPSNVLTSGGGADVFVVMLAPDGTTTWAKRFGGALNQQGTGIAADGIADDGSYNIYITGTFEGSLDIGGEVLSSKGSSDLFLIKLDSTGKLLCSGRLATGGTDLWDPLRRIQVASTDSGRVYLAGGWGDGSLDFGDGPWVSGGGLDAFVAKFGPPAL